jgi:release factor glutamine methyltransferase
MTPGIVRRGSGSGRDAGTVAHAVREVEERLANSGIECARSEASQLVGHVAGLSWSELLLRRDEPLRDADVARLRELSQQRTQGRPLQYLMGEVAFRDLVLRIDERSLIPRPETELLVDEALQRLRPVAARREVLVADVGCGCGAIGLSLATELPSATVVLTDISAPALELARENAAALPGLRNRVDFRLGRDLEPLHDRAGQLDAIVCNPPYVATAEIATLQAELQFEPRVALDGGADGLDSCRRVAFEGPWLIRPGGFVAVEVGAGQAAQVRSLLADTAAEVETRKDYQDIERIVVAVRAAR